MVAATPVQMAIGYCSDSLEAYCPVLDLAVAAVVAAAVEPPDTHLEVVNFQMVAGLVASV